MIDIPDAMARFDYCPKSGTFRQKNKSNKRMPGDILGTPNADGYLTLRMKNGNQYAHRVAFAMHFGREPNGLIDHINGNRRDNRIDNLREASPSVNQFNRKGLSVNNTSGAIGVRPFRNKWIVQIANKHIGLFCTFEEAVLASEQARSEAAAQALELLTEQLPQAA